MSTEDRARLILDSIALGRKEAARKHGVSERTLSRAVAAAKADPEVAQAVRDKRAALDAEKDAEWRRQAPAALESAVRFLQRAAEQADPKAPEAIHAVAGALKLLSAEMMGWKALDVRLARSAGPAVPPHGSVGATGPAGSPPIRLVGAAG